MPVQPELVEKEKPYRYYSVIAQQKGRPSAVQNRPVPNASRYQIWLWQCFN
jgi:hypothetical protein